MSDNENLLKDTLEVLQQNNKTVQDIEWIGSKSGEYCITWTEFEKIAANTNYDSGYGSNEINEELVIVGKDWWLERGEYDGSEWWSFKQKPSVQSGYKSFNTVLVKGCQSNWNL